MPFSLFLLSPLLFLILRNALENVDKVISSNFISFSFLQTFMQTAANLRRKRLYSFIISTLVLALHEQQISVLEHRRAGRLNVFAFALYKDN